jgi:dihydroorotase
LLGVMLDHVNNGRLTLERLADMMAEGPHRIHQIAGKGRIAQGYDADFTIIDLQTRHTITNAEQASKCGWTPFDGVTVKGWPVMTVIRGNLVMRNGQLVGVPVGKPVRFREILG